MAQSVWALSERPKEILEIVTVDPAWKSLLPKDSKVVAATGHGASFWSQTARIDVQLGDGTDKAYFLKLAPLYEMVRGEFESMKALHSIASHMVPEPVGYGVCEEDPTTNFFLCEFVPLHDELPEIVDFCRHLAGIHLKSMESSDGRFGFPVITCNGTVPQKNEWTTSWENFFIEALKYEFQLERDVHGPNEDIDILLPDILEKVCPRLLRPLETEGRQLKPCLIHGDCWDGNVATHSDTGQAYIYDSSAFWGHNEYEMHMWRGERYRIRKSFLNEYFNHFSVSQPEDDWDERNLLYSLRADLHDSILFPSTNNFRNLIIETMKTLVETFPDGYTGTAQCKDRQIQPNSSSAKPEPRLLNLDNEPALAAMLSGSVAQIPSSNVSPSIAALLHDATITDATGQSTVVDRQEWSLDSVDDSTIQIRIGEPAMGPF